MIFPCIGIENSYDYGDEPYLVYCRMAVRNASRYLKDNSKIMSSEKKAHRLISVETAFRLMERYRYDSFGWFDGNVPSKPQDRFLRRFLMLAQRCIYPEYERQQRESMVERIESVLRKINEGYNVQTLGEEGQKALAFFAIVDNRLKKVEHPLWLFGFW